MSDSLSTSAAQNSALKICVDISKIIVSSHDAEETLTHTAKMIAEQMNVDACSIYVHDPDNDMLVLKATFGLQTGKVDEVKIGASEGLIGLVFHSQKVIQVAEMLTHPRFKHFPKINEGEYTSFIGVPFLEHRKAFGVISLNTRKQRHFTQEEEELLITIASQMAGLISKALLMGRLSGSATTPAVTKVSNKRVTCSSLASGVALKQAVVLQKDSLTEPRRQTSRSVEQEWESFQYALESTITDTIALIDQVSNHVSPDEAAIFHAHLMFLEDHGFQNKIKTYIEDGNAAVWSIYQVIQEYLKAFDTIDDPYLKDRGTDLKDVGYRLLHHLGYGQLSSFEREGILIANQLLPGDVARLDPSKVKGIITTSSAVVSHAAILARSLLIPAVSVTEDILDSIKDGDMIAMDGQSGFLVINPGKQMTEEFRRLLAEQELYLYQLETLQEQPCQTKDGCRINVLANVGLLNDLDKLSHYGAQGIGLYRSEVYFMSLNQYPTIDEQVEVYSQLFEKRPEGAPLIFRTLDIGADKFAPYMALPREENTHLGERSLRRLLKDPHILKDQIKALLLASVKQPDVYLLFPMITHLAELQQVKAVYQECRKELRAQKKPIGKPGIGVMLEVPAAVMMCDFLAPEVDMMAIGSNDLTQYMMAVDRNNPRVAHLYDPLSPAVLTMIQKVIKSGKKHKKLVELCGEMSSDPDGCVLLVGLGLRHLSMNAGLIPIVKERLSLITLKEAQELAKQALLLPGAIEVRKMITQFFEKQHP